MAPLQVEGELRAQVVAWLGETQPGIRPVMVSEGLSEGEEQ